MKPPHDELLAGLDPLRRFSDRAADYVKWRPDYTAAAYDCMLEGLDPPATLVVFGIPEVALIDMQGDVMENKQLAPTYEVEPYPALIAQGRDQQLEKAVEVLMSKKPALAKQ